MRRSRTSTEREHWAFPFPMKLGGIKSVDNAHDDSVWAVTWAPATATRPPLLLTGSLDETVRLWKSDDLILERTNTGHCLGVASVAAHPLGSIAASSSLDSFVRVFDVDSNATIATLEAPPSEVWQMRFDPKVIRIASFSSNFTFSALGIWENSIIFVTPRPSVVQFSCSHNNSISLWVLNPNSFLLNKPKNTEQSCGNE